MTFCPNDARLCVAHRPLGSSAGTSQASAVRAVWGCRLIAEPLHGGGQTAQGLTNTNQDPEVSLQCPTGTGSPGKWNPAKNQGCSVFSFSSLPVQDN